LLREEIDMLVLPSYDVPTWREQFGFVLIEAMSHSVPVIGTTGGEIQHVIGDAGVVVEQNNLEELIKSLRTMMADDKMRKSYGKKGFERVNECYTHEVIAHKTHDFFLELLGKEANG
jgi:glycosyltransferase involved in cell wall biosynthesis